MLDKCMWNEGTELFSGLAEGRAKTYAWSGMCEALWFNHREGMLTR